MLTLTMRTRDKSSPDVGPPHHFTVDWIPSRTAIVVCDMWQIDYRAWPDHSCVAAVKRVAEMAPHMNRALAAARQLGVLIFHCPSGCMKAYRDWPQRRDARQLQPASTGLELPQFYERDPLREPPLPITVDGFCDAPGHPTDPERQLEALDILDGDLIADRREPGVIAKRRGITNVLIMGVHANICVLGRPFGIRHMVSLGLQVALVRDLTDSLFNERQPPFVDHWAGHDLVIEHIERYCCPTITSTDLVGGAPFRFSDDPRRAEPLAD